MSSRASFVRTLPKYASRPSMRAAVMFRRLVSTITTRSLNFVSVFAMARTIRAAVLLKVEAKAGGRALVTLQNTIEIDGEAKPALIAESLALLTAKREAA